MPSIEKFTLIIGDNKIWANVNITQEKADYLIKTMNGVYEAAKGSGGVVMDWGNVTFTAYYRELRAKQLEALEVQNN